MKRTAVTRTLLLILGLTVLLAVSLTGCGSGTVTTAVTTAATTAAATTAATTQNPDTESLAELNALYAAAYSKIASTYKPDEATIGTVLFAAEGSAADGTKVVALKVRSAKSFNNQGFTSTGWDEAEPSPYTMAIVISKATNKVTAWRVLVDGTKKKDYFAVPEKKINAYMTVAITGEKAFDTFMDGLVLDLEFPSSKASDGSTIITGTSIVFTGASVDGTLSGQLVRHCFQTAAYFYSNYAK